MSYLHNFIVILLGCCCNKNMTSNVQSSEETNISPTDDTKTVTVDTINPICCEIICNELDPDLTLGTKILKEMTECETCTVRQLSNGLDPTLIADVNKTAAAGESVPELDILTLAAVADHNEQIQYQEIVAEQAIKLGAHNTLMKSLSKKNNVTKCKTSITGKYFVYRTGYTSRIEEHIPSTLSKYDPETKCFTKLSPPKLNDNDLYEKCKGCDRSSNECPHHSMICFIDTLWGDGLSVCNRYFDMPETQRKTISNDITMIINSYNPEEVAGIVIFENRIVCGTLPDVVHIEILDGYEILKELEYCYMGRITDVKIIHVPQATGSLYTFDYVNVNVDSEAG